MLVALLCAGISCDRRTQSDENAGEIIARVGDSTISIKEFEAEWLKRSRVNLSPSETLKRREQLLADLLLNKAARQRAQMSGFDRRPEIQALVDQLIANRYMDEALLAGSTEQCSIPDSEIAAYYETHPDQFQTSTKVRAGIILIKCSKKATKAKREELRSTATELHQQAQAMNEGSFKQLVQQRSEDQSTRYIGGDTGWLTADGQASRWDPEVTHAALALKLPGELAPLIKTDTGFYIIRLNERRESCIAPLEQVADTIRYQLQQSRQREQQEAIRYEVTNGLDIEINRTALESVSQPTPLELGTPPPIPGS